MPATADRRSVLPLLATALCCAVLLGASAGAGAGQELARLCQANSLFVSDNPETVRETRGLFHAETGEARCVRLLYHHENGHPTSPMALQVWARDDVDTGAQLKVTLGAGGPGPDPMIAGHRAAVRFWNALLSEGATPVDVAPHQWKALMTAVLQPHDVVSGLAQIEIVSGRLTIVVLAYLPGASEANISPSSFLARVGTHPFGVFKTPLIEQHFTAPLDRPRGLLLASGGFLTGSQQHSTLKGNYGVIYHLRVDCINLSNQPVLLTLDLHALNGPAAGTFVVNGTLVDVPPLGREGRREVSRYRIPPGRWPLEIWTSPEGGSAYPVRLDFVPGATAE